MDTQRPIANRSFGRRSLMRGAFGLSTIAATGALAACAPKGGSGADPSAFERIVPEPDGDITWFSWESYVDEEVLAAFQDEYGVKVSLEYFDSDDTMIQKLASGLPYDLITNNSAYMYRSIEGGLIRPIDFADLENAGELLPFFDKPPYDAGEQRYSVPWGLSSTGILVRTDKGITIDGWNTLWNAANEVPGHVTVLPQTEETIGMSLIRLGYDLNSDDPDEVTEAVDELIKLKPGLLQVSSDTENDVAGGSAWVAHTWPGSAYRTLTAMSDPENWDFIQPEEGVPFGGDVLTIGAEAKAPGTAMLLMDWMLRPENSVKNVTYTGYPNGTEAGDAQYSEMMKEFPFLNMGADVYETADWKESAVGERLGLYTEQWNRFIA